MIIIKSFSKKAKVFILLFVFNLIFSNMLYVHAAVPEVLAETAVLIDQESGRILYSKFENNKMYPASTTKILTAILAVEYLDMNEIYITGEEVNEVPWDSSKAGHLVGESISGENLIRGLIIPSGNETACVVAKLVAEKSTKTDNLPYAEAEKVFAELMNKKAKELGAVNTNFINPHGYHDENHYTTALDIALISREAMKNETIKRIAAEKYFEGNGAGKNATANMITQEYKWSSHNLLLNSNGHSYPYATGIKTGFTNEAGDSLAASAEKEGKKFIAVVFNSKDPGRWDDAKELFEYAFYNYNYEEIVTAGEKIESLKINNPKLGEDDVMEIITSESYTMLLSKDELNQIKNNIEFDNSKLVMPENTSEMYLQTPALKDDIVGKLKVAFNGKDIFEENLLVSKNAESRSFKTNVEYYVNFVKENAFTKIAIPFWIALVAFVILIISLILFIRRKRRERKSGGLRFK